MDRGGGSYYGGEMLPKEHGPVVTPNDFGMKWHKFLIYFSLWAGAAGYAYNGFKQLTGLVYGTNGEADMVYSMFPSMKAVDMGFSLLLFALAAFSIYTRFQLAGFRTGAPKKLTTLYTASLIIGVGYLAAAAKALDAPIGEFIDAETVGTIVGSAALIIVNIVYYNKRAALFVN